jgi:hypothetical protein
VILVDANLLLYAYIRGYPQHEVARQWLDDQLNDSPRVGLPWPSLLAFVRIAANPRIFERPSTVGQAWAQARAWLSLEAAWIPSPTDRHEECLASLLEAATFDANLVPDAHLAALAVEHGLTLCSSDGDFARFPGLRWRNPLAER